VPSGDASGATWTVQDLGGQVAAATSAPLATAPATYTTAAAYGVSDMPQCFCLREVWSDYVGCCLSGR
jgi:hypothetical protein